MKKLALLALVVAGLCACNNDFENGEMYSCNEQLNEWAHANIRSIHSMDREDWQELDEEYKIAAFNAMTPAQKILFWKDKIREVLLLDWNAQERQHITQLYMFLENNPNMYDPEVLDDAEESEKSTRFFAQWEVDALYDLGWSEEQVYGIIYTGNKLLNKNGEYQIRQTLRLRSSDEGSGTSANCNCYSGQSGCYGSCIHETTTGCGTLYKSPCNGKK